MAGPFHSFVILAGMRTGSNLLEANLNALEGVTSYGEVFNPHFVGKKTAEELFGVTIAQRERDPRPLLEKLRSETDGLSGFRFFHDHDPRVLDIVLADPACAKIILTRNPIDSFVSLQIARTTGQWKLADARRLKSATVHFDEGAFTEHLARNQAFQLQVLHRLQCSGQTAFILDYEDLQTVAALNGLAAHLGLAARLRVVDDSLKKQNPEPLLDRLDNPEEMAGAVARADLFGLARSPIFEPRRPVAAQDCAAVKNAGLLFFPISAAPDAEVRAWLTGFGPLEDGLDQKSLRLWKRDNPGHRSFTVIRHPLLRAYEAFHSRIVSGQLANHRRTLIRAYGARLPEPAQAFANPGDERQAFLVFLHYARLSVLGQCGQRVDSHWASQTAVLQSLSAFHPVDHILREDALAACLPLITGRRSQENPWQPGPGAMVAGLAAIYDDRIEAAGAAAYGRDYAGFGFSRWRDQAAC